MAKSHRFYHAIRPHLGIGGKITSVSGQKMLSNCTWLRVCRTKWYVDRMSSPSPKPYPFHIYGTRDRRTAFGATDFLRANDRLASLMPTALRIGNLQKDVKVTLPPMYAGCEVLSLQEGNLTLAVPSSAVAAKLKQQLPKLQAGLQKKGWQVESVRIKIQVGRALAQQAQLEKKSGDGLK